MDAGYSTLPVNTIDDAIRTVFGNAQLFSIALMVAGPDRWAIDKDKMRNLMAGVRKLVILSDAVNDLEMLTGAYDVGACGYLDLGMASEALLKSIELVNLGQRLFPSRFVAFQAREQIEARADGTRAGQLSAREMEILGFVATGDSNRAIAERLKISEGTVKSHLRAITRKLGVANRTKAAIWARDHGFMPPA
jgi:two-component system nitrate/nitrite response regulator NarL